MIDPLLVLVEVLRLGKKVGREIGETLSLNQQVPFLKQRFR
jgi:hypothetical protein